MLNNSCIYIGKVIHKRFKPKEHFFKYNVFSLFIDLKELSKLIPNSALMIGSTKEEEEKKH